MARIIYNDPERLKDWAVEHYPDAAVDGDTHSIGMEIDGQLVVVTLYNNFTPHMCNMHVVSDGGRRWCTRGFLAAAFAYPFHQLGLNRVTALVPAKNKAALKLDMWLGFKPEGTMAEAMGDDDLIVLGMLRRDCIWLPEEQHGRR
jgi:RimJ/RimL family protein N-acetyltransferase